jgi:hypothetical protein
MHDAAMDLLAEPAFEYGIDWLPVMLPLIQGERFDLELSSRRGLIPGLSYGLERVFEAGGLAGAWPVAIACGVAALRGQGSSSLPGFFDMLASYAHEVPDPQIPDEFRALADQSIDDPLHTQARRLVAALERP